MHTAAHALVSTDGVAGAPYRRGGRRRAALLLLGMLLANAGVVLAPIDYRALGGYGYPAVFLVTLLATGAVVVPVPYLALIVVAGSALDPTLVALLAGLAAALGELTGYAAGRAGRSLLATQQWYVLAERAVERFGVGVVLLASVVPNPVFDPVGVVAGAGRLPVWRFLLAVFLGKTARFWLVASLGGNVLPV